MYLPVTVEAINTAYWLTHGTFWRAGAFPVGTTRSKEPVFGSNSVPTNSGEPDLGGWRAP